MKKIISTLGIITLFSFLLISCENTLDSSEISNNNKKLEKLANKAQGKKGPQASATCTNAGSTGMTAVYVNESVKNTTINFSDHSCDLAIYFDENAPQNAVVRNTQIIQETGGAGESTGLWNNGGQVTVSNSAFITDFEGQYLPIRYDDGAGGAIMKNELSGTHRSGILIRGEGTEVDVKGNSVIGSGAKTSGWAENGIQVDQGATASIVNNNITGHWWDGESNWASAGIILFGSKSEVTNNSFHNNEFSIYLAGNDNKVKSNKTTSSIISKSSFDFKAYGALVAGSDNHLAGNTFSSIHNGGAVGVYIFSSAIDSKVTGNRIRGFATPVFDGGSDSMIRGTPVPVKGIQ